VFQSLPLNGGDMVCSLRCGVLKGLPRTIEVANIGCGELRDLCALVAVVPHNAFVCQFAERFLDRSARNFKLV
jgi:hypothetical protein